jgi:segregation and condensation protein B
MVVEASTTLSVHDAAELLGRDRTRIYALVRSGDLVGAPDADHTLRIDRSSLERWLVAGGTRGSPQTPRNAWAIIGLASGDDALCERTLGLLPRAEDLSRARARLARQSVLELAPRLRRRATLKVLHVPPSVLAALEKDAALVRTGVSAAAPYGWDELTTGDPWALDAYVHADALRRLEASPVSTPAALTVSVLLRAVDGLWPFPPNYQLAPQPLAALDLLDYPDELARRRGREVLRSLALAEPTTIARRSARARVLLGPLVGKALGVASDRPARPVVDGDPRVDTRAAAAHIVGILWVTASQGATVKELRAATGMTRERLEAAYEYLVEHPPLGLAVQRQRDELFLVSAPEVGNSIERHVGNPRPQPLTKAATEVLAIVAYKQPITRAGIEHIRGTNSDSALDTLLVRDLVEFDQHHLLITTRTFLDFAGLRDLADLRMLPDVDPDDLQRADLRSSTYPDSDVAHEGKRTRHSRARARASLARPR